MNDFNLIHPNQKEMIVISNFYIHMNSGRNIMYIPPNH